MIIDEKVEHIVEKTLSISIAAYNVEEFLKNTLDSLVAPEIMDDIEVLIIDDGSKDNTAAIGKEFVDKYPNSFQKYHISLVYNFATRRKTCPLPVTRYQGPFPTMLQH